MLREKYVWWNLIQESTMLELLDSDEASNRDMAEGYGCKIDFILDR